MSAFHEVTGATPVPGALCYIDPNSNFLYFTTQNLARQYGDDWDDVPYEHNAGTPYMPVWHRRPEERAEGKALCDCASCLRDWDGTKPRWEIWRVLATFGRLETPHEGWDNSPFSVEQINRREVPWLSTEFPKIRHRLKKRSGPPPFPTMGTKVEIYAGASFRATLRLLRQAGGDVLVRLGELEEYLREQRELDDPDYAGESPLLD